MIIKIQVSLSPGPVQVLIYNRDRSVVHELPYEEEIEDLMGDRVKAYFHAVLVGDELVIEDEAPVQEW